MSDHSPRLELPYLQSAQAQKHVTHNEALRILDMVTQLAVVAFDQTIPPALPEEGEIYALGLGASGDWLGHDGELALLADGYWHFLSPQPGWMATEAGTDRIRLWTGGAWVAPAGPSFQNRPGVGINTPSDGSNRLAVAAPNTLLSHEGAGHQVKVNKASVSETASLLFQDDWSGRAEMGLAGDDDFRIKVSADGSGWTDALRINAGTGTVALSLAPLARLDLSGVAASLPVTAVDVLVYDTSRDSDGGAWRQRCQHTSWWNETLNTATRGVRREFPAVAVIVAEAARITIHDGDDPALPMWRVLDFTGYSLKATAARNGQIAVALAANGLSVLDLPGDALVVSPRFTTASTPAIVSNATNDVAMTVLPGAPADPVTGLPVPTIALATAAGVSVIRDDGSVVDIAYSTYSVAARVAFRPDGALVFSIGPSTAGQGWIHVFRRIPASDVLETNGYAKGSSDEHYTALYNAAYSLDLQWPGVWTANAAACLAPDAWGGAQGLIRLAPNPAAPAKGMLAAITASHNSGWMVGATKGAFLSSTDSAALVGSGELVTNGTFDSDLSGWSALTPETVLTQNAGRIRVASTTAGAYGKAAATVPTVIGKTYVVQLEGFAGTGSPYVYVGSSPGASNYAAFSPGAGAVTFVALAATAHITLYSSGAIGAFHSEYDNVSVRLADPDRSGGARGLVVQGTLTRTAVATGAALMGYGGWSAANYLEQPHNPALDFGTGDFCLMGWVSFTGSATQCLVARQDAGLSGARLRIETAGGSIIASSSGATLTGTLPMNTGAWGQVVYLRKDGVAQLYLNGRLHLSAADTASITNTSAKMRLGVNVNGADPFTAGALALWRIGATAPSAEQIRQIHEDEKALFQPGAQCTLHGGANAVTALAQHIETGLLHVGTSAGRSDFRGLRRIATTTTAVTAALSAAGGLIAEQ